SGQRPVRRPQYRPRLDILEARVLLSNNITIAGSDNNIYWTGSGFIASGANASLSAQTLKDYLLQYNVIIDAGDCSIVNNHEPGNITWSPGFDTDIAIPGYGPTGLRFQSGTAGSVSIGSAILSPVVGTNAITINAGDKVTITGSLSVGSLTVN